MHDEKSGVRFSLGEVEGAKAEPSLSVLWPTLQGA